MFFADRLILDKARRSASGYLAIHAKAARVGVYQYLGHELDPQAEHFAADQIVNVYRDAAQVFDKASLGSFVGKPITDNHPIEAVDATNWAVLAKGTIMQAARDGEFVGFDLAFMDAGLIAKLDAGTRELSNGYSAELVIGDGVAPDGTAYQASQVNIRGNHVAVVQDGRAGTQCCIGDAAICAPIPSDQVAKLLVDQRTYDAAVISDKNGDNAANPIGERAVPKIILIDGLSVDVSNPDVAEQTIGTIRDARDAATARASKAETDLAAALTDKATADAENVTLKQQLADAKLTPAQLHAAAKSFADVAGKAVALGVKVADDADEAAIRRAVVDAKLGKVAEGWTDAQVEASFAALTVDAKPADEGKRDAIADAIGNGVRTLTDGKAANVSARNAFLARKENAYLGDRA